MSNTIEYVFSLQDKISAKIGNITITSDRMLDKFAELERKNQTVNRTFSETGKTMGALREKIALLQEEREWIPADNIEGIRAYNREIKALGKEIQKLESLNGGKLKKWSREAFAALPGSNFAANPLVASAAAIGFAGKSAMSLDESMAQVNITAQLDEAGLSDLEKRLKQIAADNKTDVLVTPVGFEAINSQVNDVDLSLQILDAALKGSKAGFTDLNTVSAALAQTLSIVGKENASAQEVLDTFFAAKRVGAGEFADFARYMPNLIAGADSLGIAYKEVAGTFAYMTGKGQSAERAAVLMENAFSVLGRGDVRKKLSAAGVDVFDDAGNIRSVVDIFTDLEKVLGRMTNEQKSSFLENAGLVDKEAKSAFAVLTSDIGKLKESMYDVANATGETESALGFSNNSIQKATELWNQLKNIGTEVGELLLPVISVGLVIAGGALEAVSAVLNSVIDFFSGWYSLLQEGNPLILGLTTTIGLLSAALAVQYAWSKRMLVVGGLKKAMDAALTLGTKLLTAAQWALNAAFIASPLGWVAAILGIVTAAVMTCWKRFEGFRIAVLGAWSVIKEFGKALLASIVHPVKQVLSGIGSVGRAIVSLFKGNFKEAAGIAKEGFKDIGEGFLGATPVSVVHKTLKNGNYAAAWEKGKQAGQESWQADRNPAYASRPLIPETLVANPEPMAGTEFNALMASMGTGSKKEKGKVLRLDDNIQNMNETAAYTAIARKLEPVTVPMQVVKPSGLGSEAAGKQPSGTPATSQGANDREQAYNPEKENYLADIMQNVRKIAAAVAVPVVLATVPAGKATGIPVPELSDAYNVEHSRKSDIQFTADNSRTYNGSGHSIQVAKVCDEIVIHVANTDQKGTDTIRREIMNVLEELGEG